MGNVTGMGRVRVFNGLDDAVAGSELLRFGSAAAKVKVFPGWWGKRDSNPHALRHVILSHARLPIPTFPRGVHRLIRRPSRELLK